MGPAFYALLVSGVLAADPACRGPEPLGFLYQPCYSTDLLLRPPARPYFPQAGDLILCTDYGKFWTVTHDWAGAGHPHHSGILVPRPDGTLAALEAGPHNTLHIRVVSLDGHLTRYEEEGTVWIRRRKVPLTPEQAEALMNFACKVDGGWFALFRQGVQLTPFRSRGPHRTEWMGGPHPNRKRFFCSELVTEALAAACLIDPETARPAATYPSDLFFDCSKNPWINEHLNLSHEWDPPARWVSQVTPACFELPPVKAAPGAIPVPPMKPVPGTIELPAELLPAPKR